MFGLGMGEILLLGILGLILIGPDQLPDLARTLGRFLNELKRSTAGLTEDIKKQAKVDIDLEFLNPNKSHLKHFEDEKDINLIQPPEEKVVESTTQSTSDITKNTPTDENQLSLFPEAEPTSTKNSKT